MTYLISPGGVLEAEKKSSQSRCFGALMPYLRAGKKGNGLNRTLFDLKHPKWWLFMANFFLVLDRLCYIFAVQYYKHQAGPGF